MSFCLLAVYLQGLQASRSHSSCFYGCVDLVLPYSKTDSVMIGIKTNEKPKKQPDSYASVANIQQRCVYWCKYIDVDSHIENIGRFR